MTWDWEVIKAKYAPVTVVEKAATNGERRRVPGEHSAYVRAGIADQLELLRNATPGTSRTRNTTLFISAKALGRIEGVDRDWLTDELIECCQVNGYISDDGIRQTRRSIRSGYDAADKEGPRILPIEEEHYFEEVSAEFFKITKPGGSPVRSAPRIKTSWIFEIEGDFWERDSLAAVFDSALMRMTPPWGVLAHGVARGLLRVPPCVKLPPVIGGPASLNWFAGVSSASAGGKSSSGEVGAALVSRDIRDTQIRNMGSGEGLVAQYRPPGRNPDDQEALMFLCDEIDTMTAMRDRLGSTTTSVLCNAFMGNPPGHSYVKNVKARALEKHGYRMTLILGVQPGLAGSLLDDRYSGMLQRFQWFPGFDSRCTRARTRPGELVYPLAVPDIGAWPHHELILKIPDEAVEQILTEGERRNQGLTDALEGHMLLVRLKFAYGLAVLDERIEMNLEDWRLAGIAMEVSRRTRAWVEQEYAKVADELATLRGRPMGLTRLAADEARADMTDQKVLECSRWIYGRLNKVGPQTTRELQQSCDHKHRRWFAGATRYLQDNGWAEMAKCTDGPTRWFLIEGSKQ